MKNSTGLKYYYKLLIWSFVIAYLCFAPSNEFKKVHIPIPHFDKVVHFVMFYILGLLSEAIVIKLRVNRIRFILAGAFYAVIIEIIQHFLILGRNGDVYDFIADMFGLVIGFITFKMCPMFAKRLMES